MERKGHREGGLEIIEFSCRPDPDAKTQRVSVPAAFFESLEGLDGEYKAEVLAMEAGRNSTAVEQEFELEGDDDGVDDDDADDDE